MSDVSFIGPCLFDDDWYIDSHSPSDTSVDTSRMENSPDIIVVESNEGEDNAGGTNAAIGIGSTQVNKTNIKEHTPYAKRKRKKTSRDISKR